MWPTSLYLIARETEKLTRNQHTPDRSKCVRYDYVRLEPTDFSDFPLLSKINFPSKVSGGAISPSRWER